LRTVFRRSPDAAKPAAKQAHVAEQEDVVRLQQLAREHAVDAESHRPDDQERDERKQKADVPGERLAPPAQFSERGRSSQAVTRRGSSSTYPTPRMVRMSFTSNGSSTLARRRRIATSTTLVSLSKFMSQTCSAMSVRGEHPRRRCARDNRAARISFAVRSIFLSPPGKPCACAARSPGRRSSGSRRIASAPRRNNRAHAARGARRTRKA